jgi:hypothetical protein
MLQNITLTKMRIFQHLLLNIAGTPKSKKGKSAEVASVAVTFKFAGAPCYYRLHKIIKYCKGLPSNDITNTHSSAKIGQMAHII